MRLSRVCFCLFALVNFPSSIPATARPSPSGAQASGSQQAKPPKSDTQQPPTPAPSSQAWAKQQTQDQKKAAFQSRLAKIFDPNNVDLSDYVPCHFTVTELLQLRPAPPTPRLSGQEAEALKEQVEAEALAQEQAGTLDAESRTEFVANVARADLEGLTPSAALSTIIVLFRAADKTGMARRNPAAILGMYADNPLQGLAVLANVAPDWGPIGETWADEVSRQAYSQGVKAGTRSRLSPDQAEALFQSFVSQEFVNGLAAMPPAAALRAINGESKRIQEEEKNEVAELQARAASLPLGLDAGGAAAAADQAAKALGQAKAEAAVATEALQEITNTANQVHAKVEAAQNQVHLADQAIQALGQDPTTVKSLTDRRARAQADFLDAQKAWQDAQQQLLNAQKDAEQKSKAQDDAAKALQQAQKQAADALVPQNLKAAQQSETAASTADKELVGASQAPPTGTAAQAIVDSARSTIGAFKRPPDIGCAMSILSWNETRYEYGRLLSNEYIGVQVVVRNLSETQEFIMHDSAFAVDTDLTGRKGRFFSGRDKLILRGMSAADADFSPRNMLVHMMESVGTIMSAVIPIAGDAFASASSVYNSGFLQGLHKTWADHNTDHLNLLNDTAFSSATAYKTVVPKSGSVMFVMFIPAKQFEQGWWAQPCAQAISNGILLNSEDPDGSKAEALRQADPNSRSKVVKAEDQTGIDLQRARAACKLGGGGVSGDSAANSDTPSNLPGVTPFKTIHYKSWSGNALAIFRELAFTIVSGIHINEASQTNPGTSAVDCKEDSEGNIDLNEQSGGNLSCPVKGQNLDKVQKLRLRNSTDATDSKVAEGDVKVNGDATTATVTFPLAQIGPLDGASYKIFLVNKDGVESAGGQTLHFARTPFVAPPTPGPIAIDLGKDLDAKTHTKSIDLAGYHLDKVSGVKLEGSGVTLSFTVDKPSVSQASFVFDATKNQTDLEKAKKPLTLTMTFTTTDKAHPAVSSKTEISISGTLQLPAPAANTTGGAGTTGVATPPPPSKKPKSTP